MAAISQERMRELLEIYNKMKASINYIDQKYKLDYVEPKIDLPDSLNLEKMTYTPKTQQELNALAEQFVAASILAKQRTLDSSYSTKLKSISRKRTEVTRAQTDSLKKLDDTYAETLLKIERKLINNGLLFSTTANSARTNAEADYTAQKEQCNLNLQQDLAALDSEEDDLDSVYETQCRQLEEEKKALAAKRYQVLVDVEERTKTAIDKYNNSIEEKEQRYQFTRAKFVETMRRAERDRVLTMTKLYMQLGEVTYRDRMVREKYDTAQDYFWPLRREEAKLLLGYDSFLMMHLEKYYNTFVDWVNSMLLPMN